MIDLQSVWPYALAAVVVLALGVLALMLLLLRRSAKASQFADASEPPPPLVLVGRAWPGCVRRGAQLSFAIGTAGPRCLDPRFFLVDRRDQRIGSKDRAW